MYHSSYSITVTKLQNSKNAKTQKPQPGGNFGDSAGGLASVP